MHSEFDIKNLCQTNADWWRWQKHSVCLLLTQFTGFVLLLFRHRPDMIFFLNIFFYIFFSLFLWLFQCCCRWWKVKVWFTLSVNMLVKEKFLVSWNEKKIFIAIKCRLLNPFVHMTLYCLHGAFSCMISQ